MTNNKILAIYLPQFHEIKENNEWWGKGYTEWDAVRNAKPLFKNHLQPNVPLNKNYYDLNDPTGSIWKWQSKLAKQYGVYGFCIYHYWFNSNDMLLEKPMEILLEHSEIDINYCVCWANESWSRNWYGQKKEILKEQKYSEQSQVDQFKYLLKFFNDKRYIKVNNRPLICIYRCEDIPDIKWLKETWDKMAKENGFNGIYIIAARTGRKAVETRTSSINAFYDFQPGYTVNHRLSFLSKLPIYTRKLIVRMTNCVFRTSFLEEKINCKKIYKSMKKRDPNLTITTFPGVFVKWDNTPRRQNKGIYYYNTTPKTLMEQIQYYILNGESNGYDTSFIFLNAWNEWGEGCYLEPDERNRYEFLKSVKQALDNDTFGGDHSNE